MLLFERCEPPARRVTGIANCAMDRAARSPNPDRVRGDVGNVIAAPDERADAIETVDRPSEREGGGVPIARQVWRGRLKDDVSCRAHANASGTADGVTFSTALSASPPGEIST